MDSFTTALFAVMFDSITGRRVPVWFFIVRGRASGYFMHASKSLRSSWHAWALLPCAVTTTTLHS